jgi:nucleoid-associated protein YgaU
MAEGRVGKKMRASIGGKAGRPHKAPPVERKLTERKTTTKRAKMVKAGTTRVRPGESLMTISNRLFGTHQRWKEIWKLNRKELRSPSSVRARMMLKVPQIIEYESEEAER